MLKFRKPHVAITIDNVEKTKEFYQKIGFKIKDEIYSKEKGRHFLLLEGYGFEIEIFHFDNQKPQKAPKENYQKVGFLHFALPVPNLEKLRDELTRKGIKLSNNITISSSGLKYLNIIDPSGITIEFFEASD
jgi:catechol 2,3-dioxygenase-like lactoylglutathione lyase family enzyme